MYLTCINYKPIVIHYLQTSLLSITDRNSLQRSRLLNESPSETTLPVLLLRVPSSVSIYNLIFLFLILFFLLPVVHEVDSNSDNKTKTLPGMLDVSGTLVGDATSTAGSVNSFVNTKNQDEPLIVNKESRTTRSRNRTKTRR